VARGYSRARCMSVLMVFRIAFKALGRNKMRTALTMLGMIIGVAAVITMVALGTGAQTSIEAQIQSAGTNMIQVSAGNFSSGAVLGAVVKDQLFADADPIGQVIRINNQPFTVLGMMASKGQSGMGQDQDDVVFIPFTTVMKKLRGIQFIQQATVSAASASDTTA